MKFFSLKYRGLTNPSKKLAFKCLVESIEPDLIFLQETLGEQELVKASLEGLLGGQLFETTNARGRFGGSTLGWNTRRIRHSNSWSFPSGLEMDLFSSELNIVLRVINIYGPNVERDSYCTNCSNKYFMNSALIVGDDLSFSIGIT